MVCVMCVLQPGHMYYAFIVAESFFSFCIQYIFFSSQQITFFEILFNVALD